MIRSGIKPLVKLYNHTILVIFNTIKCFEIKFTDTKCADKQVLTNKDTQIINNLH